LKDAFIQDITACVLMTDGRNIFRESAKLVDNDDDEKLNTLFLLEQIMVRLGFIAHTASLKGFLASTRSVISP
jgi:hypothetical protein